MTVPDHWVKLESWHMSQFVCRWFGGRRNMTLYRTGKGRYAVIGEHRMMAVSALDARAARRKITATIKEKIHDTD